MNKKLIRVVIPVLIVIEFSFIFLTFVSYQNKDITSIKETSKVDKERFAMYVENMDGEYEKISDNEVLKGPYKLNKEKTICTDNKGNLSDVELDYKKGRLTITSNKTSFCYLYFDTVDLDRFCEEMEIENLNECLLTSENYSSSKEYAIDYISKKPEISLKYGSPNTVFEDVSNYQENQESGIISYSEQIVLGEDYNFDPATKTYTINNKITDYINNDYVGYYTCGLEEQCTTMYKILDYKFDDTSTSYIITEADVHTSKEVVAENSENGLYRTLDNDGYTYFYRGYVENNYVSYAGFIWQVVRINGDGSIRMIYSGTTTNATGAETSIGTSSYNDQDGDPKYMGYMYGSKAVETTSERIEHTIPKGFNYAFGEAIIKNEDGTYSLDSSKDIITGQWKDLKDQVLTTHKYSCLSSVDTTCYSIYEIDEYISDTKFYVYYHSLVFAGDKNSSVANEVDSTIKSVVDNWYEMNILNAKDTNDNLLRNYLYDSTFCNDKYSSNYTLSKNVNFGFKEGNTSLLCNEDYSKLNVSNGSLKYPIGIITANEARYAGITNSSNLFNYMFTGQQYWTMTPYHYLSTYNISYNTGISNKGHYTPYSVRGKLGVRPVINLKPDIKYVSGNGTKSAPYQIAL